MNHRIYSLLVGILSGIAPAAHAQMTAQVMKKSPEQTLHYWLYLPERYEMSKQQDFPLVLFLHGGGEVGDSLALVKKNGLPREIARGKQFPFVMVAPQNPKNQLWDDALVLTLLNDIIDTYRIDEDRVYLTGMSRGGFGAWRMAIQNPDKFAAVVPVCGGGVPDYARRIKDVPVWAFHGAKDRLIPLSRTVEMVEALLAAGGNVKLTVYPEAGHDSWTETYRNPQLYEWMLQQKR